jgi:hypothetical protein
VDARASGRHHLKLRARFWHRSRLSVPDAGCLATAKCRRLQTFGTSRISPRFCEPLRMRHVIAVWDMVAEGVTLRATTAAAARPKLARCAW